MDSELRLIACKLCAKVRSFNYGRGHVKSRSWQAGSGKVGYAQADHIGVKVNRLFHLPA